MCSAGLVMGRAGEAQSRRAAGPQSRCGPRLPSDDRAGDVGPIIPLLYLVASVGTSSTPMIMALQMHMAV